MSKKTKNTKKEKEIFAIIENIISEIKNQKFFWLDNFNKYKSNDKDIEELLKKKENDYDNMDNEL